MPEKGVKTKPDTENRQDISAPQGTYEAVDN